MSSTTLHVTVR